jgi:hypothetical protein
MISWLKKLWDKSGEGKFLLSHILPMAGLFLTWGCLGHLYITTLDKEDLIKIDGRIEWIGIAPERSISRSGGTYHPLKIALIGEDDIYRLHDDFKNDFERILDSLKVGDDISLFRRSGMQTLVGWGRINDILAIEKNSATIFALERTLWYEERQRDILAFFMIVCWMGYAGHLYGKKKI